MDHYEEIDERPLSLKQRRVLSEKKKQKLLEEGEKLSPLEVKPREKIAKSFWSKRWCETLNSYEDLDHRLQEGRSLISANSVLHLELLDQKIQALVYDQDYLYKVFIEIEALSEEQKHKLQERLSEGLGSVYELLSGTFSQELSELVVSKELGLFPEASQIHFDCNCTDYASLCAHASAALIGLSKLFDEKPALFFKLRAVDPVDFVTKKSFPSESVSEEEAFRVFGIELG